MASSQLAMFGGYRHCSSEDVILVCHVISQDHVIKGSCDFAGRSPTSYILPSLVALGTVVVEI